MFNKYAYLFIFLVFISCDRQKYDIHAEIEALHNQGLFNKAESLITDYLVRNPNLDEKSVYALKFEIERGNRIINDYFMTEEDLTSTLNRTMNDFNIEEFRYWEKEGRFDILWVNGEKRYANPSVSNLFFRFPELRQRKKSQNTRSTKARLTLTLVQKLRELSVQYPDPVLLPRKCRVRQTLKIKEGRIPANEPVACWMPYPSVFQTQGDVNFVDASFKPAWIDYADSPIRSVYFEAKMPESGPLEFVIDYEYTAYAYYREIDPIMIDEFLGNEPEYQQYTREESPHKIFSPKMRDMSGQITGDETNPYLKAKKIYDWIADNIKYSYAREYSTLRNISEYCYDNRYGDCGQEAILFITLCRIAGVPARWQSGFFTFPNDEGMHDWSEIFIKPYGWIPVDIYMGIFFTSMTDDLTAEERREMRNFYFGNIDHYRLVANKGHNQPLYPPKKHFRSETVDFQRGEVEWQDGNLYFPDWRWSLKVTEIQ